MITYDNAIKTLTSKGMFYIDLGLERIRSVLSEFNNPQDDLNFIHVAGTNGKGSVCAILDTILREAGFNVGLYTSPHIFEYTERIKFNGISISKEDFAKFFELVFNTIQRINVHLTEFEIITVIMFLYFKSLKLDIVILETGMGGRLDATNVIKNNLCSIITTIALDHTDRLGQTVDKIAYEKAGIIKANCPVVTSMGYEVIKDRADELNSLFIFTSPNLQEDIFQQLSLKGLHQRENLALALASINYIFPDISDSVIKNALSKVKNPFRFEYFKDKNLIVDVCHNPNGAEALRNNLDFYFPEIKRRFVFGCLKRKDFKKMIEILFREEDEIYFNKFDYPEACSYEDLSRNCSFNSKEYFPELNLSIDKLNIMCGSFYMLKSFSRLKNLLND